MFYNQCMIEKILSVSRLFDYYAPLLTDHQRRCIEMHYLQDLSLGEIAAELGVSRQAVNDILRRTEDSMEHYETRLGLARQEQARLERLQSVRDLLAEAAQKDVSGYDELLSKVLSEIDNILKQEMGY